MGAFFGISQLVDGRIYLDGTPWSPAGPGQAIAAGVFLAGEDRWRSSLLSPFVPGADIAGTIGFPHHRRWFPAGLVRSRVENAAARLLVEKNHIRCKSTADGLDLLSGGNQQKVVLARWQAVPCRVLLLDEPFQGVDVGARHDLITAIRAEARDSATLIATSDVEEAFQMGDRVMLMQNHSVFRLIESKVEVPVDR